MITAANDRGTVMKVLEVLLVLDDLKLVRLAPDVKFYYEHPQRVAVARLIAEALGVLHEAPRPEGERAVDSL